MHPGKGQNWALWKGGPRMRHPPPTLGLVPPPTYQGVSWLLVSSFFHWSHLWGIQSKVFMVPIVLWKKHSFSARSSITWIQPAFWNPFLPIPKHSVPRKWDIKREGLGSKGTCVKWPPCLLRMRSPAIPHNLLSLLHIVSEIWIEEFVCQIKATCLNCLDGGNIFLFFLTVIMLIQFLPSSPKHTYGILLKEA